MAKRKSSGDLSESYRAFLLRQAKKGNLSAQGLREFERLYGKEVADEYRAKYGDPGDGPSFEDVMDMM